MKKKVLNAPLRDKTNEKNTYKCLACNAEIRDTFDASIHPMLGLLICRKCFVSYGTGDFSTLENGVDEEGDDNVCRLCADGGDLFGCQNVNHDDRCHHSFCGSCLKRNFINDFEMLNKIENENFISIDYKFICYVCDKSKTADLRLHSIKAIKALNSKDQMAGNLSGLTKTVTDQDIEIRFKQIDSLRRLLVSEFEDKFEQIKNIFLCTNIAKKERAILVKKATDGLKLSIDEFHMIAKRLDLLTGTV